MKKWTKERIEEVFPEIFERISEGESLISICKDKKNPAPRVFLEKIDEYEELRKRYIRAREIAALRDLDKIDQIATEPLLFVEVKQGENGLGAYSERKTIDNVQRSRLKIDAIKWRHAHTYKMLGNQNASGDRGGTRYEEEYYD